MTVECRLVYGYLHAGSEAPDQVPVQWNAIATTATKLELLLGTVFVDYRIKPLAMDRVALRALLDVVVAYHPYGVLIPSARHLSRWPHERTALVARFQSLGCAVLVADDNKASTLTTDRSEIHD